MWSKPKTGGVTRIHKIFFYGELEISVLRQQPRNDIAVNIREAEVASCIAVGQTLVVEAQFGGVTRMDKFFFYGGLKTKFLRQQPWNHITVNIREAEVTPCIAVG